MKVFAKIRKKKPTVWLRGSQEHHNMFVEDFAFNKDDNGQAESRIAGQQIMLIIIKLN